MSNVEMTLQSEQIDAQIDFQEAMPSVSNTDDVAEQDLGEQSCACSSTCGGCTCSCG